jgi:hypothetical protein
VCLYTCARIGVRARTRVEKSGVGGGGWRGKGGGYIRADVEERFRGREHYCGFLLD